MYRYILSSDSVINRMESTWYRNLEKNNNIAEKYEALCRRYSCTSSSDIRKDVSRTAESAVSKIKGIRKVLVKTSYILDMDVYVETADRSNPNLYWFVYRDGVMRLFHNEEGMNSDPYYSQILECVNSKDVLSRMNDFVEFNNALSEFPPNSDYPIPLTRPVTATYFYLFRSLIRKKGQYLIQDNDNDNVYYQITSVARRVWDDAGSTKEKGYNVSVLVPDSDGSDLDVSKQFVISNNNKSDRDLFDSNTHLPVDGTCPTIVSRDEAIPQKKLF